jgi:hypothetical protein
MKKGKILIEAGEELRKKRKKSREHSRKSKTMTHSTSHLHHRIHTVEDIRIHIKISSKRKAQ